MNAVNFGIQQQNGPAVTDEEEGKPPESSNVNSMASNSDSPTRESVSTTNLVVSDVHSAGNGVSHNEGRPGWCR